MGDEESTRDDDVPKWKSNRATLAPFKSRKNQIYSTPNEILHGKKDDTNTNEFSMGKTDFFLVKKNNVDDPESLDTSEDPIDPESLKRWEDEAVLDSIRHLFITGISGPSTKGNDDAENDEGCLSGQETLTPNKNQMNDSRSQERGSQRKFDGPKSTTTDFYTTQKDEIF